MAGSQVFAVIQSVYQNLQPTFDSRRGKLWKAMATLQCLSGISLDYVLFIEKNRFQVIVLNGSGSELRTSGKKGRFPLPLPVFNTCVSQRWDITIL